MRTHSGLDILMNSLCKYKSVGYSTKVWLQFYKDKIVSFAPNENDVNINVTQYRKTLLGRCQKEFMKDNSDELKMIKDDYTKNRTRECSPITNILNA